MSWWGRLAERRADARRARANRDRADRCFHCGVAFADGGPDARTVDHRVAQARGGTDGLANLVFACRACNARKADADERTFVASPWLAVRRAEVAAREDPGMAAAEDHRNDDASVAGAMAVTDAFLATFNDGDPAGHAATLAYPHVRLASGTVRLWQTEAEATEAMAASIPLLREKAGWDHSRWDHRRVIHTGPGKVHLDVQFTRYRADDSVIGVYPAVYVVVEADDGWRIQARSSFAP